MYFYCILYLRFYYQKQRHCCFAFQTLQLMTGVRWDIRDIMSQHNAYVDILVRVILYVNLPDSILRILMLSQIFVSFLRLKYQREIKRTAHQIGKLFRCHEQSLPASTITNAVGPVGNICMLTSQFKRDNKSLNSPSQLHTYTHTLLARPHGAFQSRCLVL